ncbi:hypothetical protein C7974DRAFT_410019 [Boeremia exigua]|uniref:uncharacterized protein n=1 Tax=Boeremia exigua TaxID=749465 RepID=UPI001E8DFB5D|nr:uncharacterized protein C7974DRAFT_410019 [Boeremia exigua]KAH6639023.1 hypothetical protein C7974DRAFT_410019 [Boeremia exigua]
MKRPLVLTVLAFAATAASRAVHAPLQSANIAGPLPAVQLRDLQFANPNTSTLAAAKGGSEPDKWPSDDDGPEPTAEEQEAIWCKARGRGIKLTKAMMMNEQDAAALLEWPYTQSPWDGDLREELKKWGYKDDFEKDPEINKQCDFDKTHEMADAFRDLGVDSRSALEGGPNHCFYVEHMDGPTVLRDEDGELPFHEDQYYPVDNKKLQVTQAYLKVGVNPVNGIVYFLHRQSPEDAAQEHWQRKPQHDELPLLRSSSDITWGMWNRVASGSQKLEHFMAVSVVNEDSNYIIDRILEMDNTDKLPGWPGKDYEFAVKLSEDGTHKELDLLKSEAAFALLGSPNGIAAGYFLIQHRRQLGWKHIWKVRIWTAGTGVYATPNILFYVTDRNPFEGVEPQGRLDEQLGALQAVQLRKRDLLCGWKRGVVHRSEDGKSMVRNHVILAKL